jgi:hypothetical protein
VARTGELVSQGVSPADAARAPQELTAGLAQANGGELTPEVARAVSNASYGAFMDGLHAAMYVGVGLAVVAALLGLLVTRGREVEAHEAGGAA